jgi:predicted CoA-binding protein
MTTCTIPTKTTLILGASTNPERYAFKAANLLRQHGHEVVLVGIKKGNVVGMEIQQDKNSIPKNIDTITLYLGPQHQEAWFDYILKVNPKRIIFNPGTENEALELLAQEHNIAIEQACTLVLLHTGQY